MNIFLASPDEIRSWLASASNERKKGTEAGYSEAESHGRNALKALIQLGDRVDRADLAFAHQSLAETLLRRYKNQEALALLEAAENIYKVLDVKTYTKSLYETRRLMARCLLNLANELANKPKQSFGDRLLGKDTGPTAEFYFQRACQVQEVCLRAQEQFLDNAVLLLGEQSRGIIRDNHPMLVKGGQSADSKAASTHALPEVPDEDEIVAYLNQHVVGQYGAKRTLAYAVREHIRRLHLPEGQRNVNENKPNVFIAGPTGCGKTLLLKILAGIAAVPLIIADSTNLTASGYRGGDIESIFHSLLTQCDWDVGKAQRAIVFIDEIDKKMKSNAENDIGGAKIQHELLPILAGTKMKVNKNGNRSAVVSNEVLVEIDTSNMLFVVAGAFSELEKILAQKIGGPSIGFGAPQAKADFSDFSLANIEDFVKFGMMPELLGRLPIRTFVKRLTRAELRHTLSEPENSLVERFREMARRDFDLRFTETALDSIAAEALAMGTNARALESIMHECLQAVKLVGKAGSKTRIINENIVCTRAEILATIASKDSASKLRSHSFIVAEVGGKLSPIARILEAVT